MDPQLSAQAEGRQGLTRASAAVLSKEAEDWVQADEPTWQS
jgi:hypothetical protein